MTTRVLDRRERSAQITLIASIAAGVALAAAVAFTAFGGGDRGNGDAGAPPIASPSPTWPDATPVPAPDETPVPAPDETPAPTPVPAPDETSRPDETPDATPGPNDGGSDAMPIMVDLETATGDDVYVDIVDRTGSLVDARSGKPGDGMSVEPYTLVAENIDSKTLKLTWVDFPIDNALALYIDESDGGMRLVLVQPEPSDPTDAVGFDRELILSFSQPISADQVETFLQDGLDTPG